MTRSTMIAAGVAAMAAAALAGAFWPGERPETSAEAPSELIEHEAVAVTEGGMQGETALGTTRSILGSSSYLREHGVSDSGASVYRSLRPERLTPVQQETGTRCETSSGFCTVPSQPIGSACRCGEGDTAMIGEITQ